jgi:dienelactone hydrolase
MRRAATTIALLAMLSCARGEDVTMIVTAANPDPQTLPMLGVWQKDKLTLVASTFPNVPDFTCDSWCYESDVDFLEARDIGEGRLELRHRLRQSPQALLVTTVTPLPGAVEFAARVQLAEGTSGELAENPLTPNLCWQLRRAPGFASAPDSYPEFIKRCFIFTEKGMTFLDETDRKKIPVRYAADPYNNPPWVQMYVGAWQEVPTAGPTSWADYSATQYATTVIGAVSRDGKYLAAIANDSAPLMCQAWHDCMHNNPCWLPANAPVGERVWRLRIYAMQNDPGKLLAQVARDFPKAKHAYQAPGVTDGLPAFRDSLAERLTFPLSWLSGSFDDFGAWRKAARAKVMECLLPPPPAVPFEPAVIAEEDRGSYVARKLTLNLTGDSRVLAYMTVPKREGPFPAVLLLHDHGARFDIGKEKVIRPFRDTPERLASAEEWVKECYGGRWLGDELARRGYVCFAHDALNWSDRGGAGYEGQQALASNLLHLGTSLAGTIAHEDLRAAEFLASRPEVNGSRVGAMGLSMGSFRTWQVSALSDHITAGVAICWMATVKGLMVPGNNQTRGQSSFTMLHPGLFNYLDYPDVAGLACPKPMLFFNGRQDALFPVPAVEEAYAKMRRIWESQRVGDRLVTKLWDVPHEFNVEMQDEAFAWLDRQLKADR